MKYDWTTGAYHSHTEEELNMLEEQDKVQYTTKPCPVCGETSVLTVSDYALRRWKAGGLIQNCFPDMPLNKRELMISGTHDSCWEKLFPVGEDE